MIAIFIIGYLMLIFWLWILFITPRIWGDAETDWRCLPAPVKKQVRMPKSIEPDMDTVMMVLDHRAHMEERGM